MSVLERLLQYPGFVYRIGNDQYFLGKWLCRKVEDTDVSDCRAMYEICSAAKEEEETSLYFQKLRAYSDFAVVPPYNPQGLKEKMGALLGPLSAGDSSGLEKQVEQFALDYERLVGPLPSSR